ncbi:MAG: DNA/RNA non-specific endonuclease [Bacteroidales bacterium]|nr:DNA/RNA non-specific endonuclease [Bacteroidales bacterium]
MRLISKFVTAIMICVATASCSKSSGSDNKPTAEVSVALKSATVEAKAGSQFMDIECDGAWTLSCSAQWVSLGSTSGNGSGSVVVTYSSNEAKESRSASLVLKASGGSAMTTLTQKGLTTTPKASVSTGDATAITKVSATISASYANASSAPREVGFEFGDDSSMSRTFQVSNTPSGSSGTFTYNITDLGEGKTYYYRAYVIIQEDSEILTFYGQMRSFNTEGSIVNPPAGGQRGWFELPLMNIATSGNYMYNAKNSDEYYAYHISPDMYIGGKQARNYTVCFSAKRHCPLWVAAPRHKAYVGGSGRSEAYGKDPDIPSNIQYNSKSTGGGCNKGHMLGSAERTSTSGTNRQVFYYSNIAPQLSTGFNTGGGGWNILEDWVDTQVCSDTLYVVIGCYFDKYTDGYGNTVQPKTIDFGGRSDVAFPTMFYYILMRTKSGSTGKSLANCSASEIKCAAFVRAHTNDLKGQKPSSKEMMSVAELEKITGFTYFPSVPNAPKTTYSASDWGL